MWSAREPSSTSREPASGRAPSSNGETSRRIVVSTSQGRVRGVRTDIAPAYPRRASQYGRVPTAADHLSRDQRRALGAVYTPAAEADLACEIALQRWGGDPATAVVCDPACGTGDFLAALVRVGGRPARLVGVDADAGALQRVAVPGAELHHGDAIVTDPARFSWGVQAPARLRPGARQPAVRAAPVARRPVRRPGQVRRPGRGGRRPDRARAAPVAPRRPGGGVPGARRVAAGRGRRAGVRDHQRVARRRLRRAAGPAPARRRASASWSSDRPSAPSRAPTSTR